MHPPKFPSICLKCCIPSARHRHDSLTLTNITVAITRLLFSAMCGGTGGGNCGYLMVDFLSTPGWSHGEHPPLAPRC